MTGSLIRGTIVNTVTVGSGGYLSPLTVASTGAITPDLSGTGVLVPAAQAGAKLFNHGTIYAGSGAIGQADAGGIGVNVGGDNVLITNTGTIAGGNGSASHSFGGAGGDAVRLETGGRLVNDGIISAGSGASGGDRVAAGGIGVECLGATTISNNGLISGGGGSGGAGVLLDGGTLVNRGSISGVGDLGRPGVGVIVDGGTVVNSGTISGGEGANGTIGRSVDFREAGTLVVDPGAVFNGAVAASPSVTFALELGGRSGGTISGLGVQINGFGGLTVGRGADWTVAGVNDLRHATNLLDDGTLSVTGTLLGAAEVAVGPHALLATVADGALQATGDLNLAGGTLSNAETGTLAVGTKLTDSGPGTISVGPAGEISGFGNIAGSPISDNGGIAALGGMLTLQDAVSGNGTVAIDNGATLRANAALGVATMAFAADGDARLVLGAPTQDSATQFGFGAGDVIDLVDLKATSVTFQNGTLTLEDKGTAVDTLLFAGDYDAQNFALSSDKHGGTDVSFVANARVTGAWSDLVDRIEFLALH